MLQKISVIKNSMIIGSFMPSEKPLANDHVVNRPPRPTKIQPITPIAFTTFFSKSVGRVERSETRHHHLFIPYVTLEYNLGVSTPIVMINPLLHKAMEGRMRPEFR